MTSSTFFSSSSFCLLPLSVLLVVTKVSLAAQLVKMNFSPNPTGMGMYEYVPNKLVANPPILVAIHWCAGSAFDMFKTSSFAQLADEYGFIVLYPDAPRSTKCFDVYTARGLDRDGGSDSQGIVAAVKTEISRHHANASRVYVTGHSSGAMMTNVLLAEYPDVFAAGAAFAGVAHGCFATTGGNIWNMTCVTGNVQQSPRQWGNLVRAASPGFDGERPRMQLWHGTTDEMLNYRNLQAEVDQWTNVLGVSRRPASTDRLNVDGVSLVRSRYGGTDTHAPVEAITMQNFGHSIYLNGARAEMALRFMGLIPAEDNSSSSSSED